MAGKQTTQDIAEVPIENRFLALVEDPNTVVDPATVQRQIMQRIMDAEDFDAALDQAEVGALSTADLAETPFKIVGVSWHKSSPAFAENSVGVFALLECEVMAGELVGQTVALTTGASNILAALAKGCTTGALPSDERQFVFRPAGTASGFTTYWLARA